MTSRAEHGHLDRATLEYIHNEWEFEDRTEAEFDDWLHGLIKAARERESTLMPREDEGVGFCAHCNWHIRYKVGGEEQAAAAQSLAEHAATCVANPLVVELCGLRALITEWCALEPGHEGPCCPVTSFPTGSGCLCGRHESAHRKSGSGSPEDEKKETGR